jgi:YegS/Rv2252/BmrU family lipid kinase
MEQALSTLVIVNPNAGSGRAGRLWHDIEPLLWEKVGELVIAVTRRPEEVAEHLDKALAAGLTRVIAVGGDGTNHAIINAIQALAKTNPTAPPMVFGQIPVGTGRDFSRALGVPIEPRQAVQWIAQAKPKALDLGLLTYDTQERYFLNIASAGIGGDVDRRVNAKAKRRPWTFRLATIQSLLGYKPPLVRVLLDDEVWYEDKSWAVVVANGRMFGHGMLIAPQAEIDDGLFDVVLVEDMPRLRAIMALNSVYSGKHLLRDDVHYRQATAVTIESRGGPLGLDIDGEHAAGERLRFVVKPKALWMLVGS